MSQRAPTPLAGRSFDALGPSPQEAARAWAERVRADREQVERCREVADPQDFYAPVADRFRLDPRRTDDAVLDVLRGLGGPTETWLDIGAGGGRYALPLALIGGGVVCVEPSDAMLEVMRTGMREHGVSRIDVIRSRWPLAPGAPTPAVDVSLMAHIGYDIEDIAAFLEAMEDSTRRLCVAVMGEGAMTTAATLFWQPIHGERRVRLPALPELLVVLLARGRLPEVRLVDRASPTFATLDELHEVARRQLWLRSGSARDRALRRLVRDAAVVRDDRLTLDARPSRIGIVTWTPRPPGTTPPSS